MINELQRRAARHRLHALIRERYGCKYSRLPVAQWKDIVVWLADGPLTSGSKAAI